MNDHYQAALDAMIQKMRNSTSGKGVRVIWFDDVMWKMELTDEVEYGVVEVNRRELIAA